MAQVIAILNPKGGSGKTTLVTNLARAFQLRGATVLLIDTDRQGTVRDWRAVADDELNMPTVVGMDRPIIHKEIPGIAHAFDYILIDGVGTLQDMMVSSIKAADLILIPVQPSSADIWAADELIDMIKARQELTDGLPKAAFVISRQKKNTILAGAIHAALEKKDIPVFEGRTSDLVAYPTALSNGSTVLDHEPEGNAAGEVEVIFANTLELLEKPTHTNPE